MVSENPGPGLGQAQQIWLYIKYSKITNYLYISPLVFLIRLFYNLPVYFVLLCNWSVLSVVSVNNENYNNNNNKIMILACHKNKQFSHRVDVQLNIRVTYFPFLHVLSDLLFVECILKLNKNKTKQTNKNDLKINCSCKFCM